jgi:hypothetical protein
MIKTTETCTLESNMFINDLEILPAKIKICKYIGMLSHAFYEVCKSVIFLALSHIYTCKVYHKNPGKYLSNSDTQCSVLYLPWLPWETQHK